MLGPSSVYVRPILGPQSALARSTLGPYSAHARPCSVHARSIFGPDSVDARSIIGPESAHSRPVLGPSIRSLCAETQRRAHADGVMSRQPRWVAKSPGPGCPRRPRVKSRCAWRWHVRASRCVVCICPFLHSCGAHACVSPPLSTFVLSGSGPGLRTPRARLHICIAACSQPGVSHPALAFGVSKAGARHPLGVVARRAPRRRHTAHIRPIFGMGTL